MMYPDEMPDLDRDLLLAVPGWEGILHRQVPMPASQTSARSATPRLPARSLGALRRNALQSFLRHHSRRCR